MKSVIVVGAGFCGAAFAIHRARAGLPTTLVDPRPDGRGAAYATHPAHVLNVRAGRMSLFPDEPHHFLDWARRHVPEAAASDFLPRVLFGRYVEELLAAHVTHVTHVTHSEHEAQVTQAAPGVSLVADTAVSAQHTHAGWRLTLQSGRSLDATSLVLATGNPSPRMPRALLAVSERVVASPWRPEALLRVGPMDRVLVLGSSLTALDVILTLREQEHRGHIRLLSRRGLLPLPHQRLPSPPATLQMPAADAGLRAWVRAVRQGVETQRAAGRPWQAVLEELRPFITPVWAGLDGDERRRFLEHLRPWWDIHRHRAPAFVLDYLRELQAAGRLEIVAGNLVHARAAEAAASGPALQVGVRRRGQAHISVEAWDWLVLATGPDLDLSKAGSLYAGLLDAGALVQDPLRIGLLTDERGRARARDGGTTPDLYVLGGARRAQLWEVTSVPELRVQAAELATLLS